MRPLQKMDMLLADSVPSILIIVLTVCLFIRWILHLRAKNTSYSFFYFILSLIVTMTGVSALIHLGGKSFHLATDWPLYSISFLTALIIESISFFYGSELQRMKKFSTFHLLGFRYAVVFLIAIMLLEPEKILEREVSHEKVVAVIIDDSASMQRIDSQMSISEKMAFISLQNSSEISYFQKLTEFQNSLEDLSALIQSEIKPEGRQDEEAITKASRLVDYQVRKLLKLAKETETSLYSFEYMNGSNKRLINNSVSSSLKNDLQMVSSNNTGSGYYAALRGVFGSLNVIRKSFKSLKEEHDKRLFTSLTEDQKQKLDSLAQIKRSDFVKFLLKSGIEDEPFITRLGKKYKVKLYSFNSGARKMDLKSYLDKKSGSDKLGELTDLPQALQLALSDTPVQNFAGALVFWDGRMNSQANLTKVVQKYSTQKVPLIPVIIGSKLHPADAAIVKVNSPKHIVIGDVFNAQVRFSLKGLKGAKAKIEMLYEDKVIDEQEVTALTNNHSGSVKLSYTPENEMHYRFKARVVIENNDTVPENNLWEFDTFVRDGKVDILLVDEKPRWEFRYLKNLWDKRDQNIHLQYVLLSPDYITGSEIPVSTPASVENSRTGATALPKNEEEWLKFDTIILGDISPEELTQKRREILDKFVTERGGTLIVIAGSNYMPHAYGDETFRKLMPVIYHSSQETAKAPEQEFKINITPAGVRHDIMQLIPGFSKNLKLWESIPVLHWRHEYISLKPSAMALAYASNTYSKKYEEGSALIVTQQRGAGRVLLMNHESSWKLRRFLGDKLHHRFWGQVLRWSKSAATITEDMANSIITSKYKYMNSETVKVTAIIHEKKTIQNDDAFVKVYEKNKLVLRKKLSYIKMSKGEFEADLGTMPRNGLFRIELECESSNAEKVKKTITNFQVVEDGKIQKEMMFANTDDAISLQIASETGGEVLPVTNIDRSLKLLGQGTQKYTVVKNTTLWDNWILLCLILFALSGEWASRKYLGLI